MAWWVQVVVHITVRPLHGSVWYGDGVNANVINDMASAV